jgi:hypothetical protein
MPAYMTSIVERLQTLTSADQGDAERSSGARLHSHVD